MAPSGHGALLMLLLLASALGASGSPGQDYDGLAWFVHITDIHISHLEAPDRISQLEEFVQSTLSVLRPEVVLCGGDLTDAKRPGHLSAAQSPEEWETYQRVVDSRWNQVPWLDIRGNHDDLNVFGRNSSNNLFVKHSVQGRNGNLNSYMFPWEARGQRFNFMAVDATWEMGVNFPFNFIGYLDDEEQQRLEAFKTKPGEVNVVFGHYPTSVVQQSAYLRHFLSSGLVYMSGHLHDLLLFHVHKLYSFHGDRQVLELELADWKQNRAFRLFAVDHGTFSFIDLKSDSESKKFGGSLWPVVLPTFPKESQFWMPTREPTARLEDGGAVRLLAFSDVPIVSVTVGVDGGSTVNASAVSGGPLYTAPWHPSYSRGRHTLRVTATDSAGRTATHTHTFTLEPDLAVPISNWIPNLVLCSSFVTVFHVMFSMTLLVNLSVLAYLRLGPALAPRLRPCRGCCLVRKLLLVCSHDRLFYPLLAFLLYMTVGPWVVGGLIEGRTGAVFAWGVVVQGQMAHSQTTFVWYFFHFGLLHPVMVLVIGHVADWRVGRVGGRRVQAGQHLAAGLLLLLGLAGALFLSLTFWLQFGFMGFFLGPLKTWSYVFYGLMVWVAATLPEEACVRLGALTTPRLGEKKTDGDGSQEEDSNHMLESA